MAYPLHSGQLEGPAVENKFIFTGALQVEATFKEKQQQQRRSINIGKEQKHQSIKGASNIVVVSILREEWQHQSGVMQD